MVRFYSTQPFSLTNNKNNVQQLDGGVLPPWFISGFAFIFSFFLIIILLLPNNKVIIIKKGKNLAEGSFVIIVRKSVKSRLGWRVEAVFRIGLHKKDLALLKQIQAYFGGIGSIVKQGEDVYAYRVSYLKEILSHILPHFYKFPLITKKQGDYLLWREVVLKMEAKEHLNMDGLQAIVNIRASINLGLSEELKTAFPYTVVVPRPIIENKNRAIPHPEWVAGFATGL
uniref:LAGLIDADG endonuclease n=1 Tax=Sclerotinia borealis TaxID=77105 RepID=A0A088CQV6_9HELO|nr:LAGLIDADG endonuclease [Sclerotinia borealis]AIJ56806.1 LAGLIDADG endonuclease [Sclerotinia borealis]